MIAKEKNGLLILAQHQIAAGEYLMAELTLKKIIDADPADGKANELMGYAYEAQDKPHIALHFFKISSQAKDCPYQVDYSLGSLLLNAGNYGEAVKSFQTALSKSEFFFEALHDLGTTYALMGRLEEGVACYLKALKLKDDSPELFFNLGRLFDELKKYPEALTHYEKAITLNSHFSQAWFNSGTAYYELKQYKEALSRYNQAISIEPNFAEAHYNRGNALAELNQLEESLKSYNRAISIDPHYAEAFNSRGKILVELKRFNDAIDSYNKAISIHLNYPSAHWNLSLCQLLTGNYEAGWLEYEWRWKDDAIRSVAGIRHFLEPIWHGTEPLNGKTILLYAEQGLGDTIQFARYAPLVTKLGAKVLLEVQPPLAQLLRGVEGVHKVVVRGEKLPKFDYQCPLMSLPLAFKTTLETIPNSTPYIFSEKNKAAKWRDKLGRKNKLRIGITWSSDSSFKNDNLRSMSFSQFVRCLPLTNSDYEFIALQKVIKENDKDLFYSQNKIKFYGDSFEDFSDTAALIEGLDLVISTCTSIPHLTCAMNIPTWVLLPYSPDWRWLLDREDSPWYPSAKLYRQAEFDVWDDVLLKVKMDLENHFK